MAEPEIPTAAKTLLKKLSDWSVKVTHATGRLEFGGLSEETDGEGKRHRVSVPEDVDSCLVQARHVDGRAFVALWVHRHGQCTAAGGKKWKLDLAWRGRRPGEWTPKQITATELKAYVEPVLAMERAA
jgi:hypothetical protein